MSQEIEEADGRLCKNLDKGTLAYQSTTEEGKLYISDLGNLS